ncbi:MAG TPA: polyprenyl diphosphate synthase [Candidatus Nanoarchaeia archaeon]|nr:polyprenyl diphosphate synthase [Candidatus Nanoarchaeia archaeon]
MKKELKHVAIILDGNRRWAVQHNLPKFKGHEKGFNKIKDFLQWCIDLAIPEATLYCFSTENFKRDRKEVSYLFDLFRKEFDSFAEDQVIHKNKVRINVIGKMAMFPTDIQKRMRNIMARTKKYSHYTLNLALAYGGRAEIVDAVKNMLKDKKTNISERVLKSYLYLDHDPDLIIRPGGEMRLSNFLMWQSAYAELIFMKKFWPDFSKKDLQACIKEYRKRRRRFGT